MNLVLTSMEMGSPIYFLHIRIVQNTIQLIIVCMKDFYTLVVNPWIDKARTIYLEFFFEYFGDYEKYLTLNGSEMSFDSRGYLEERNTSRGSLLEEIISGQLFQSHLQVKFLFFYDSESGFRERPYFNSCET